MRSFQSAYMGPVASSLPPTQPFTSKSFALEIPPDNAKRWSSLIGIVTAISGNVLISFALNIQRYAHVRLSREREKLSLKKKACVIAEAGPSSPVARTIDQRLDLELDAPIVSDRYNGTDGSDSDFSSTAGLSDSLLSTASHNVTSSTVPASPASHRHEEKQYLSSPIWWAGFLLMSLGECGNFLAYGFAPASIVSPLGVVALISNCIIAPLMLKEPFRKRDFSGVVIAIIGVVIVVLSSKPEESKLGPDLILHAISSPTFLIYFCITVALMLTLAHLSSHEPTSGTTMIGQRSILVDLGLVGLFGGYTALATKGISSLLTYSFWLVVTYPIFYLLLLVLVATAILQIKYLNRALERFESTQVIPTQFVLFTLSVIVGSAILYRDFEKADVGRVTKFITGCSFTFWGVYLITSLRSKSDEDLEDANKNEAHAKMKRYHDTFYSETHFGQSHGARTIGSSERRLGSGQRNASEGSDHDHVGYCRLMAKLSERTPPLSVVAPSRLSEITPLLEEGAHQATSYTSDRSFNPGEELESNPSQQSTTVRGNLKSLKTSHRKSISDLFPGPIVVGLSPLQAIVAAGEGSVKRSGPRSSHDPPQQSKTRRSRGWSDVVGDHDRSAGRLAGPRLLRESTFTYGEGLSRSGSLPLPDP